MVEPDSEQYVENLFPLPLHRLWSLNILGYVMTWILLSSLCRLRRKYALNILNAWRVYFVEFWPAGQYILLFAFHTIYRALCFQLTQCILMTVGISVINLITTINSTIWIIVHSWGLGGVLWCALHAMLCFYSRWVFTAENEYSQCKY